MPVESPAWPKSGVVAAGRNVFIVARVMSRGNVIMPPPSMCCEDRTESNRVNESKLLTLISGSSGSDRTGVER